MTLWKDENGNIHDDMNGEALSNPLWPSGLVQITLEEAELIRATKTSEQIAEAIKSGLSTARQMRETILNRLSGIAGRYQRAGDVGAASACDAAQEALLNITKLPAVLAATNELALKTAILTEYRNIAGGLAVSAPYAVAAFEGYEA